MERVEGVVIESGQRMKVSVAGEDHACVVSGRLRVKGSFPVVGDRVELEIRQSRHMVVGLMPRRSVLTRLEPSRRRPVVHVIAANLDLALLVVPIREPEFKPHLVDRLIVAAVTGSMEPVLVLNKIDLATPEEVRSKLEPFRSAGLPLLPVSAQTGEGIPELKRHLVDRSSVLVGQSGVGKTTIANRLLGTEHLTQSLSHSTGKGRHTTTVSRLVPLPGGGYLADLPGFRQLPLPQFDRPVLLEAFPELATRAQDCRFRDCSHLGDEGCAVQAALERGEIPPSRFESYSRLLQEANEDRR